MFVVNEDSSLYATRGDMVAFQVAVEENGESYTFQPGELLRFRVFEKKACDRVLLQLDFPVLEAAKEATIALSSQEMKFGPLISKPMDYWYEVELIRGDEAQTIIGYDEDGPKVFRLFPEGSEL